MSGPVTVASRQTEIDALIERLQNDPWPDGVGPARKKYDLMGSPIAQDIDVEPIDVDGIGGQMLAPPICDQDRVILFLHGGGYVFGSLKSHGGMAGEIARACRCRLLQLDYRRAPEHPHPAAVDDSVAACGWLRRQGYAPDKTVIIGDSAGGGLVVATLIALKAALNPLPGAVVCISPWVDLEATGESYVTRKDMDPAVQEKVVREVAAHYLQDQNPRTPTASPIHADLSGLPPMLVQVGEREILYSDAEALAAKAEAAGVDVIFEEWKDMIHVWHFYFPELQDGRHAIERIGDFVTSATSDPSTAPVA